MNTANLKILSNNALVAKTKQLVDEERRLCLEVIHHLHEIFLRKIYLDCGYPSLFEMCLQEFGYTNAAAQRRIDTMRLLHDLPQVEEKIISGELSISTASQIQVFFAREEKDEKTYLPEQKLELLNALSGKSTRVVERGLVKISPKAALPDKVRWVTDDLVEIKATLEAKTFENLDKLKILLSHVDPTMSMGDLLKHLSEIALDKFDPERKEERSEKRLRNKAQKMAAVDFNSAQETQNVHDLSRDRESFPAPETPKIRRRHIPAKVRRQVYLRDGGKCTYIDPRTQRRCEARHLAQTDHVEPFALGGTHEAENLRMFCAAHNQYRAQKTWPRFQPKN